MIMKRSKQILFFHGIFLIATACFLFMLWSSIPDFLIAKNAEHFWRLFYNIMLISIIPASWFSSTVVIRDIAIVGSTGSGKSTLIERFRSRKRKNTFILSGTDIYNSYRKGSDEIVFPEGLLTCKFLIIDDLPSIKDTPYWNGLLRVINQRKSIDSRFRIVLVAQCEAEIKALELAIFTSKTRFINLTNSTDFPKALKTLRYEYSKSGIEKELCLIPWYCLMAITFAVLLNNLIK